VNGYDYYNDPGWQDDALLINAIALSWWRQFSGGPGGVYSEPGVSVTTGSGVYGATASPLIWLLLIGLVLWVVLK
jgi:hypothetical protein